MSNDQPVTVDILKTELEVVVRAIRDELDMKLAAQSNELKLHTEEVVAAHSTEILQTISEVIEPMQADIKSLDQRVTLLEQAS